MAVTPSFSERDQQRYVGELAELLRIPSVSADPGHREGVRAAADWLAARLSFIGGRVAESDGHPVVLAEWLGAEGAPTVLVYGHYDVQPAGDEEAWESPPFEPTVRDGRIHARGATDDKGPLLVPIAVVEAFLEQHGRLPVNVRFLLEGEEELGSASLPRFLAARRGELAADLVVSADGAMWRPDEPSVAIAAKGLVALDVTVEGPASDLHSGRYGGAVRNPLHVLAELLAGLHAPDGRVLVPGFYDDVVELGPAERAALARIPFDEDAYRAQVGVDALHGEAGYSTLERLWTRPTLDVNGITGGGAYTVVPRRAAAHLSCRLVPAQDPGRIGEAIAGELRRRCPSGARVGVAVQPGAVPAYVLPSDHPAVAAAQTALGRVYPDREPLLVRMGGTLPAATIFEDVLGLKTLMFSFSTADERLHAPNEFFRLRRLHEGMRAWSELLTLLAA